ncbi:MAG: CvpA family protein [Bacteroidales bacterium]|nr:CvpA family protein [Bacteroidales bacterium]
MDLTFNVNLNFSLFGLVIFGLLVWGGYRGYKVGAIVVGLSLFALAAGFIIAGIITKIVYTYFMNQGSIVPHIFGSIVLGVSFIGAIWFSHYVLKAVKKRTSDNHLDIAERSIGAALGVVKFFLIIGIYSVVILNLDKNGNFLPQREKESHFLNASAWVMTKTFKLIKMDKHENGPINYPTGPQNNGIIFPNSNNNNTNNSNSNNNSNVIKDVDDENF